LEFHSATRFDNALDLRAAPGARKVAHPGRYFLLENWDCSDITLPLRDSFRLICSWVKQLPASLMHCVSGQDQDVTEKQHLRTSSLANGLLSGTETLLLEPFALSF
jgi:hypothetical protein